MRINISIEARMTSTRLPGKVLMEAQGMPLLEMLVRRCRKAKNVNEVIVATTTNRTDDAIVELCERIGAPCFRGSEHDVMERVTKCHQQFESDLIVELTGDNPLQDPRLIDDCVDFFLANKFDYVSNCGPNRNLPIGQNVQVFPLQVLAEALAATQAPDDHEHVSLYLYRSGRYRCGYVITSDPYLAHPELNFTVDVRQEYEFVKTLAERFPNLDFGLRELVQLLEREPELLKIRGKGGK